MLAFSFTKTQLNQMDRSWVRERDSVRGFTAIHIRLVGSLELLISQTALCLSFVFRIL